MLQEPKIQLQSTNESCQGLSEPPSSLKFYFLSHNFFPLRHFNWKNKLRVGSGGVFLSP